MVGLICVIITDKTHDACIFAKEWQDKSICEIIFLFILQNFLQANDARNELLEKVKEVSELKLESMGLKQDLKFADDQCVLLFNEVQKAWKVSFTLQSDLKVCSTMRFSY